MTAARFEKEATMIIYGTIKTYDENRGRGSIAPEGGGEILRFGRGDVPLKGEQPRERERFSYEIGRDAVGKNCAVKLLRAEAVKA